MNSTIERHRPEVNKTTIDNGPSIDWTDEELLLEYRARGDSRAFEQLVQRYERELYSYLRNYLGDAQMAEDTFQTTFLQVHLKCGQFQEGRKVRPWLYTVATHQAIDAQRRNRRHRMVSLDHRIGGGKGQTALGELIGSDEPGPTEWVESAERREEVQDAVGSLPESLRQVILLVYYQGMKYREAANVLDIPVGTVKSRLHSAVSRLSGTLSTMAKSN